MPQHAATRNDALLRDVATTSECILKLVDALAGQYGGLMRAAAAARR
jgi:hypothetical protein